jgi:hypothetical protein
LVSVADFGAAGDGADSRRDTRAFHEAMAAAERGGSRTIVVPYGADGLYRVDEPIRLADGMRLVCDPGVRVEAGEGDGRGIVLENADREHGNDHIVVEGGAWVGAMSFRRVRDIRLEGFTIRNDGFAITLDGAQRFVVRDIRIEQRGERSVNQDGIHVFGPACDGEIRNIHGRTFDDMIALNADDNDGPHGPIVGVTIDGVRAEDTYNFLRLMSRGSLVDRILVRDVSGNSSVNGGFESSPHRFPETGNFGSLVFESIRVGNRGNAVHPTFKFHGTFRSILLSDVERLDAPPMPLVEFARGSVRNAMLRGVIAAGGGPLVQVDSEVETMVLDGWIADLRSAAPRERLVDARRGTVGKLEMCAVVVHAAKETP